MKRVGLGSLFVGWLYGVPFLLIVGMIRRASSPYQQTHDSAQRFATVTNAVLTTALVVNAVVPTAGILVARLLRDRYWTRHFAWSTAGAVLTYAAVSAIATATTAPLIGSVPVDHEPAPRVTQCIPRSGGHGCPGG